MRGTLKHLLLITIPSVVILNDTQIRIRLFKFLIIFFIFFFMVGKPLIRFSLKPISCS